MNDKLYDEAGTNYRFFLSWRHAAFAGYLLVLYGVMTLTLAALKDAKGVAWIVPGVGSGIGIVLWMIDFRTRDLYHAAIRAGKALEGEPGGFFNELARSAVLPPGASPFSRVTQTGALNILFLGGSGVMFLAALCLIRWR